jgi:hypothetical protein
MWKKAVARWLGEALGTVTSRLRRPLRNPPVRGWGKAAVRFRQRSASGGAPTTWSPAAGRR